MSRWGSVLRVTLGGRWNREFAGLAHSAGEENWWSGKEELKNLSEPAKPGNIPCCRRFCHKGNEGKPKQHKKAKSYLKPIKTEEFAGFVHSAGEVNWWSSKEERQNQERNRLEVAETETPLTSSSARTTGKTECFPPEKHGGEMRAQQVR